MAFQLPRRSASGTGKGGIAGAGAGAGAGASAEVRHEQNKLKKVQNSKAYLITRPLVKLQP